MPASGRAVANTCGKLVGRAASAPLPKPHDIAAIRNAARKPLAMCFATIRFASGVIWPICCDAR